MNDAAKISKNGYLPSSNVIVIAFMMRENISSQSLRTL